MGAGAGAKVTARGVFGDILRLSETKKNNVTMKFNKIALYSESMENSIDKLKMENFETSR
jgi:hypothetical protein